MQRYQPFCLGVAVFAFVPELSVVVAYLKKNYIVILSDCLLLYRLQWARARLLWHWITCMLLLDKETGCALKTCT
jgi:hypothetical protein